MKSKIRLTESEKRLLRRIITESEERKLSRSELAGLVSELETYISDNSIRIVNDRQLAKICNHFFKECGHEELAGSFAVDQVVSYVKEMYGNW